MGYGEALFLGLLQGITEFLPVSSSGHLVLGESLIGLEVEALKSFDVVVHLGTFAAIIIYFWKDIVGLFKGFFSYMGLAKKTSDNKEYRHLIGYIVIGTIPAVVVGLFLEEAIDFLFRSTLYVGLWMIIVAEIFILAEWTSKKFKKEKRLDWKKSVLIGVAQAAALIPGVSRSGSTIAAGLFQGISREKAARFSFLLALPAIFGAGLLTGIKEFRAGGGLDVAFVPLIIGFVASAVAGFVAVYFLMKFLKKHSLNIFTYYLFAIGTVSILVSFL
ncbi:undecaprenyl-diphosphatase UppP [Candidatus Peregrinibacteria bacterium]|nr:undecaprenyl-diphosphatase UppP [Candidatus Peregrinibacteria bacterium]